RRERRFLVALAAAVVLGLSAVAVIGVRPSTLVHTNALLPETPRGADTSDEPARDGNIAAVGENKPVVETTELAGARAASPPGLDSAREGSVRSGAERGAASAVGTAAPRVAAPS